MPKILFAGPSPFSAKVLMAAVVAGIECEPVTVDTAAAPDVLTASNPLGKIPVLITDAGEAIFDSRGITHWLDRQSKGRLYPRNGDKRTEAEVLEALGDGLGDVLIAHVYERRQRPAEKVHQPWLDKQWSKAERALDRLNAAPPRLTKRPNAGHLSIRAVLGYLDLRFPGQWEKGRPKLKRWARSFDRRFPVLATMLPRQA